MKLKIRLFERGVNISTSEGEELVKGGDIGDLLAQAKKYGRMIERVEIKGDCESYTFKRQVFLFANLINYIQGSDRQIFPEYKYVKKTTS